MLFVLSGDKPIFEFNFLNKAEKLQTYFIIHSCLDAIDTLLEYKRQFFLGQLRTQQLPIFCYVNAVGLKLLLAITMKRQFDKKSQLAIRDFLIEVNKSLSLVLMNPLYNGGKVNGRDKKLGSQMYYEQIKSPSLEAKINELGKQFLRPILGDKRKI